MKKINDQMNYEKIIKEALPNALIEYCNYDDDYFGWDICPKPGTMIKFMVYTQNQIQVKITIYKIKTYSHSNTEYYEKQVYLGTIPDDESEPDFKFIMQLLKNWQCQLELTYK